MKTIENRSLKPTFGVLVLLLLSMLMLASRQDVGRGSLFTRKATTVVEPPQQEPPSFQAMAKQSVKILHPVVLEVGALALMQSVGLPVFAKVAAVGLRRFKVIKVLRPQHIKLISVSTGRLWKGGLSIYGKTSASKLVNRSKKMLQPYFGHDDH